jgi:hypothetical protein
LEVKAWSLTSCICALVGGCSVIDSILPSVDFTKYFFFVTMSVDVIFDSVVLFKMDAS